MRAVPPTGTIDEDGRSSRRLSARRVNRTAFRRVWAQVAVDDVSAPEPPRKNEDAGRKPQLTLAELVEDSGEQLRQRLLPQAPQPGVPTTSLRKPTLSASRRSRTCGRNPERVRTDSSPRARRGPTLSSSASSIAGDGHPAGCDPIRAIEITEVPAPPHRHDDVRHRAGREVKRVGRPAASPPRALPPRSLK